LLYRTERSFSHGGTKLTTDQVGHLPPVGPAATWRYHRRGLRPAHRCEPGRDRRPAPRPRRI